MLEPTSVAPFTVIESIVLSEDGAATRTVTLCVKVAPD